MSDHVPAPAAFVPLPFAFQRTTPWSGGTRALRLDASCWTFAAVDFFLEQMLLLRLYLHFSRVSENKIASGLRSVSFE
jgi:hypothetical protein